MQRYSTDILKSSWIYGLQWKKIGEQYQICVTIKGDRLKAEAYQAAIMGDQIKLRVFGIVGYLSLE